MAGMKIKKGDTVLIRSGKDKGKTGTVLSANPTENSVIVEGINISKRHTKPKAAGEAGSIRDIEMSINVSNVGIIGPNGAAVRVGYKIAADGTKTRIARGKGKGASL
jgi:large subunit ribosomal protein L24